jgi:AbiV family abortive infection protein
MLEKGGGILTALSFSKLEEAYIMVYENANELLEESRLLFEHKRYARCYSLAQFAHEELAKLPIIYQEATRAFFREEHDWKNFYKRLRSHESKNKMNYVFNEPIKGMVTSWDEIEDNLKSTNNLKNVSVYADVKNNKFTKPANEISKKMAESLLKKAEMQFNICSLGDFHKKGNIKKSLDNELSKENRKILKELGLIK